MTSVTKDDVSYRWSEIIEIRTAWGTEKYRHLYITIKDTGETLTVDRAIEYSHQGEEMIQGCYLTGIQFADGNMTWDDICFANGWLYQAQGTEGDDDIWVQDFRGGLLRGLGGNDRIRGSIYSDLIYGGAGNDFISGNDYGNDILYGEDGGSYTHLTLQTKRDGVVPGVP